MSSTPPPDDSSYRFSLAPLPPPPRRQTPEIVQSLTDDFDDPTIPVEEQRGFSWLANYPHDPLRALCFYYNVAKAPIGIGNPLPQTIDMEVIQKAQMPTHVLALSRLQMSETSHPLMIPIHAQKWGEKITTPIPSTPPESPLPILRWDTTRTRPCQVITLPVVPLEVPHPESVAILLLFALGLEPLPNMLASCLLPSDAVGEFPAASEMSNAMANNHSIDEISGYVEQNRRIWENALNLGVRDRKIIDMVGKAWKVTARARDKLNYRRVSGR